jgi:hypothetical protein
LPYLSPGVLDAAMKRLLLGASVAFGLLAGTAHAAHYFPVKIAQGGSTLRPGTTNLMNYLFSGLTVEGSRMAFGDEGGIYLANGTNLITVADTEHVAAGTTERFTGFAGGLTMDQGVVYFTAFTANYLWSIYRWQDGVVSLLVPEGTPMPGSGLPMLDFSDVTVEGGRVVFRASWYVDPVYGPFFEGIFSYSDGRIDLIADNNTPMPGTGGFFGIIDAYYPYGAATLLSGMVGPYVSRIYAGLGGAVIPLPDPPGAPVGTDTSGFAYRDGMTVFARSVPDVYGFPGLVSIFKAPVLGTAQFVAGIGTPDPDTGVPFAALEHDYIAVDSSAVAFHARAGNAPSQYFFNAWDGVYSDIGGSLRTVVRHGSTVEGEYVERSYLDPEGLDGTSLAVVCQPLNSQDASDATYRKSLIRFEYVSSDAHIVAGDLDGDARGDLTLFDPATATWFLRPSVAGGRTVQPFGYAVVQPAAADYDGDGRTDIAVFSSVDGAWYILGTAAGFMARSFGYEGVTSVPADYDGDGMADAAVWDPRNGTWFVSGSSTGFVSRQFGFAGSEPVAGDYDGDGRADYAVYDPAAGLWYLLMTSAGFQMRPFGFAGAAAAPADFDGDGTTDVAVYDRASGMWYVLASTAGFFAQQFGYGGTRPAPADYDGDGSADLGVFDPNTGAWYLLQSTDGFAAR